MSSSNSTFSGGEFSFEIWLKKNDLLKYKELFIQHKMTTIDTISTSSSYYSQLLSNPQIVSDPLLISKIALTVNNLQTAYKQLKDDVIIKMENKLKELNKYERNTGDHNKNIINKNGELSKSLLFNHQLYEVEKNKDETQLNEIRVQIQELFLSIFKILKQKEQIILKKFKNVQQEILIKYNKIIEKMKKNDDEIMIQKDYLNQHINLYKHKIKDNNLNSNYDSIFQIRETIYKIGKNIKKNDSKIRKLVNEKQRILDHISLNVNTEIKEYIINNIDKLINFENDTKKKSKKKLTSQHRKSDYHHISKNGNGNMSHDHINGNNRYYHNIHKHKLRRNSSNYNNLAITSSKNGHNHNYVQSNKKKKKNGHHYKGSPSMDSSIHLLQQELKLDLKNNKHLDLINMSPNRIKKLKWIYDHDDEENNHNGGNDQVYNIINIQLLKKINNKELQNLGVLYHYHCNEEDEKDNLVINETIDIDQNGEDDDGKSHPAKDQNDVEILSNDEMDDDEEEDDDEDDDDEDDVNEDEHSNNHLAPDTPFYNKNEDLTETENETIENESKLSHWQKCKDVTLKEGTNHLLIKIPQPSVPMNIDCVWIKIVDIGYNNRHLSNNNSLVKPIPSTLSRSAMTSPRADSSINVPITKLMVEAGQTVKLQSSVEYNFDEIIIHKNGILTVNCTSKGYLLLKIRDKLEIHAYGKLNVTGLGHKGGKRYTAGEGKGGGGGCAKGYYYIIHIVYISEIYT